MNRVLRFLVPLAVIAVGVLVAVALIANRPEVETAKPELPAPLVRTLTVEAGDHQFEVGAQGVVASHAATTLVAEVGAKITAAAPNFAVGARFRRGDVLLRLDPRNYQLAVAQAEAQVASAEAGLARENAETEIAAEEWELLGEGEAGPLARREPQLADARARLAAAQATRDRARLDLERTVIRAPYAGQVRRKLADIGQSLAPGTPVVEIFATDYAEIRLPITVDDLAFLDLEQGSPVTLSADWAGETRTWPGRIVRNEGEIDPRTRMINLVARVEDPFGAAARTAGAPLTLGLFVEATIEGRAAEGVAVLPRSVLRGPRTQSADGRSQDRVLIVEENQLRFRTVEILRLAGERVVLESGVRVGEQVVLTPLEAPVDGMVVRLAANEPSPEETP